MSSRKIGRGKSTPPLPVSEGQERNNSSGVSGPPSTRGNNTIHRGPARRDNTRPTINVHEDVNHMRPTSNIPSSQVVSSVQRQSSSQPNSSSPKRDGRETSHHHSNTEGPSSGPPVEYGPQVGVLVLGPDPRLTARRADKKPSVATNSETARAVPTGACASRGATSTEQKAERQSMESPPRASYRERSRSRSKGRSGRRRSGSRTPAQLSRRDHYSPPPSDDFQNTGERSRDFRREGDSWRPKRRRDQRSRSPSRTRRAVAPNASDGQGRKGSDERRATPRGHDGSLGRQAGQKDFIQADHRSANPPKETSRGRVGSGGDGGDGRAGNKPQMVAGLPSSGSPSSLIVAAFGSGAETVGANPSLAVAIPSPKGALLKPSATASTPPNINISPSAKTEIVSTTSPPTMDDPESFIQNTSAGSPPGATGPPVTLSSPVPQWPLTPSQSALLSMAQDIPELDTEYEADREMAKKLLGITGEEFDAEMASRRAEFDADVARRKALGHPIHGSQVVHPDGQNPHAASLEIGESSRYAQKSQVDATSDDSASRFMPNTHMDSNDAMPPGPDGIIAHADRPSPDVKGKGKQIAGASDSDKDSSKETLWPGAGSLDNPGLFASISPRLQPGSTSFVAGGPDYFLPRGSYNSSPGPLPPASSPPPGSNQRSETPKYVDRGCSPDPAFNCTACGPTLVVSVEGCQSALYNVHLKDHDPFANQLFSNVPKDYYLFHVLTFPPYKSRLIYSDQYMTLRNFTKVVRLAFDMHGSLSSITVYLYGKDKEGHPLDWKPIAINCQEDWDGAMIVGRQWSCQVSVVVEFAPREDSAAANAMTPENSENGENKAGPSK